MWILGISKSHNGAVALTYNGKIISAIQAERISRIKRQPLKLNEDNTKLEAEISGDDVSNYDTHGDIKAVTYSDMEIVEKKGKSYAMVVLDI